MEFTKDTINNLVAENGGIMAACLKDAWNWSGPGEDMGIGPQGLEGYLLGCGLKMFPKGKNFDGSWQDSFYIYDPKETVGKIILLLNNPSIENADKLFNIGADYTENTETLRQIQDVLNRRGVQ